MRIFPFPRRKQQAQDRNGKHPRRAMVRNYVGGQQDRLTDDWFSSDLTANQAIYNRGRVMRNRARNLEQNDPYTRRFLQMVSSNVFGHQGIRLNADVVDMAQDGATTPDAGANRRLEEGWARWGKRGMCTMDGRLSWRALERMVLRRVLVDGEALIRLVRGADNDFGFALQFLDSDLLDELKNQSSARGRSKIVMGVEMDVNDRPLAYHLKTSVETVASDYSRKTTRVPADEILHIYIQERPAQYRGITWLASTMWRQKMLDGFEDAALVGARVAAAKMGFLVPDGENYTGEGMAADGWTQMSAEPGEFEQLPYGMRVEKWDPDSPPTNLAEFEKEMKRGIASGLNVSYVTLANDLEGVSYSSIRQGELADRDMWRLFQTFCVEHVSEPIADEWLVMALTTGAVNLPIAKLDKFRAFKWRPRGWEWVDPDKEGKAAERAIRNRLKSRTQIIAEQGNDINDLWLEIQREENLGTGLGLSLPTDEEDEDERPEESDQQNQ